MINKEFCTGCKYLEDVDGALSCLAMRMQIKQMDERECPKDQRSLTPMQNCACGSEPELCEVRNVARLSFSGLCPACGRQGEISLYPELARRKWNAGRDEKHFKVQEAGRVEE